ncbi:MAG: hypothetical protein JJW00_09990, partial [Sulfurimonas sp.]|nr:hypothetical protein [Sulfurimonas sp.]
GESIYISFSDNDSDIEEYYFEYKIIRKIRKFWITTEYKLNEKIQGKQVVMR